MRKIVLLALLMLIYVSSFSQSTQIKYLSGTDKGHTVQWNFFCTGGRKSGKWSKIAVPSNWEQQGFGTYNYGTDKNKADEQGIYKYEFTTGAWKEKNVFIVFEGSMTDTKVLINGQQAGAVHQGGFYRFKYDITKLLKFNTKNLLEVTVSKMSANASVNDAERKKPDFWIFGGIFRPVYLEIVPNTFIDRTSINAKADGSIQLNVFAKNLHNDEVITAQVQKLNGENVGKAFSVTANSTAEHSELESNIKNPLLWSDENPNLYQVVVSLKNKKGIIHQIKQKFGFRTVELRLNDGLYLNGTKIILKGICRHSFWPESGRTLSHDIQLMDVKLLKQMNANAVRMSHYPPDLDFLNVCDSLGIYVLDELVGVTLSYDTVVGPKLIKEMVIRDVNHPAVILWENGWNTLLDNNFALDDPQKRVVLHPWANFNGAQTKHYPDYNNVLKTLSTTKDVFFPTEFMHGLYDGGAGAGLDDFWSLMRKYPQNAGGFIWALLDEAIIRTDKNNIYDTNGSNAPDGILGPHREKEASFFAIKEIWSPIYIDPKPIDANFEGKIDVENRYSFTNLNACSFKWKLVKFPGPKSKSTAATITLSGTADINLAPGSKGTLNLKLPATWNKNDALYLTACDKDKKEVFTWSWPITEPSAIAKTPISSVRMPTTASEIVNDLVVNSNHIKYYFDKTTGYISKIVKPSLTISLSGGPVLAGVKTTLKSFSHTADDGKQIVEADYMGDASMHVKWTFAFNKPVKLEYSYTQTGDVDYNGITFNYPEDKVTGIKWLGRGPYKVWKNRLRGQLFGVFHKDYNNTITGENWKYPEFKGYHAEVNWVVLENKEAPFTIYTDDKDIFFQIYKPSRPVAANDKVMPPMPTGSIGFLNGIGAMGTKFHEARQMGPQGQKNTLTGEPINGTLWFEF